MRSALALALVGAGCAEDRPWMNVADPPEERAKKLVAEMTTEEKLGLFHGSCGGYTGNVCGIDRLGVPQQKFNDGPQGFRGKAGTSTSWPAALTVAASFDTDLMQKYGEAMGDEFYRKGSNVQLGPGMCIARVPHNGRNFEYLSGEDPYLGYHMAKASVTGIQSQGVVANAKHFIDNNQETDRGSFTANVDQRTQFEMYYPPFQGAIDAGVGSVMCSYNKECIDCPADEIGRWSCENHDSLTRDLKERMGFKGWVMSDWGGTHSTSMNAGLDQEMPGSNFMGDKLAKMVQDGTVSMDKVDDSAVRNMWPYFKMGLFDKENTNTADNDVTTDEHNTLARDLAAASTVLLKNEGLLPLSTDQKIVVVGDQATNPTVHGGGSGTVSPKYVANPLAGIQAAVGVPKNNCSDGAFEQDIDYHNQNEQSSAPAGTVDECCALCAGNPSCNAYTLAGGTCWMKANADGRKSSSGAQSGLCVKQGGVTFVPSNTQDIAAAVEGADVAIVFAGTSSSEGGDRGDLSLGSEDTLIQNVAKALGKKTIVVPVTPGALLTPWRDDVGAIITPVMPGQEYGNAIADVLFGTVNPSARLPVTFPNKENEVEMSKDQYPGTNGISVYSEGMEVGYRWYNAHNVKPAYAFGHGLSYTQFEYSDLQISQRSVSVKIKNTGDVDGAEVPQLYLGFPASAQEPPKQLKGFQKIHLKAGRKKKVTFPLTDRDFSIWEFSTATSNCSSGAFEQDIDYRNDNQQTSAPASSVDDCCALCASNFDCNAYTLADGTCWMKANADGRVGKSGAKSGMCTKQPGSAQWSVVSGDFDVMVGASSEDIRLTGKLTNGELVV